MRWLEPTDPEPAPPVRPGPATEYPARCGAYRPADAPPVSEPPVARSTGALIRILWNTRRPRWVWRRR